MIGSFNIRFVLRITGFTLVTEALFLMLCAVVSFYYMENAGNVFLWCSLFTVCVGAFLRILGAKDIHKNTTKREIFLTIVWVWVLLSVFGMLPFYFSEVVPRWSDAFFEAMSGFTTTGATVLQQIDTAPKGLLLWRSIMQWMGGISAIVFALLLLPSVGENASGLYNSEISGISKDKFSPKIKQAVGRLWTIYLIITLLLSFLLCLGPMNVFDSVCHALTTVSSGGFSTKQANIAHWNSPYLEYILSLFMLIGGINFSWIYLLCKGRCKTMIRNEELRWYLLLVFLFTAILTAGVYYSGQVEHLDHILRHSAFQVISAITTTGFSTFDYTTWGNFYAMIVSVLMLCGACAGSVSGGLKLTRVIMAFKNLANEFKRQLHPNAIFPVRLNRNVLPIETLSKVLSFILLYIFILIGSFLTLGFFGMNFEESLSASVSCMSNAGPALGTLGPNGNYANIPELSKWYLSFLMLVGRLEIFTLLCLFTPAFWRR